MTVQSSPAPGVRELPDIELLEGRRLQVCEVGDPDGKVALYLHGTGSSRLEVALYAKAGLEHGVRFVAWNRPGVGGSTEQPGRTPRDVVADAKAVAAAVGADRPVVVGHSGGGSHVLVLVVLAPDFVRAGIAVNPGPPADDTILELLPFSVRLPIKLARDRPKAFDRVGKGMEGDRGPLSKVLQRFVLDPADYAVAHDPVIGPLLKTAAHEAAQQPRAYTKEALSIWGEPWGVTLSDFHVPLHLYAGRRDPFLPFALHLADEGASLHYLDGAHTAGFVAEALDEVAARVADLAR